MTQNRNKESKIVSRPIVISGLLFTLAGFIAVSVWPIKPTFVKSESILYLVIAILFVVLGAPALLPAFFSGNKERAGKFKFLICFIPAFAFFAGCWCFFYFILPDHRGEIFGSGIGLLGFVYLYQIPFRSDSPILYLFGWLFTVYTVTYYLGEHLYKNFRAESPILAALAWGLCIGLGLGFGFATVAADLRPKSSSN